MGMDVRGRNLFQPGLAEGFPAVSAWDCICILNIFLHTFLLRYGSPPGCSLFPLHLLGALIPPSSPRQVGTCARHPWRYT